MSQPTPRGEYITLFPNNPFGKSFSFCGDPGRVSQIFDPYAILSRIAKIPVIYTGNVNLWNIPGYQSIHLSKLNWTSNLWQFAPLIWVKKVAIYSSFLGKSLCFLKFAFGKGSAFLSNMFTPATAIIRSRINWGFLVVELELLQFKVCWPQTRSWFAKKHSFTLGQNSSPCTTLKLIILHCVTCVSGVIHSG